MEKKSAQTKRDLTEAFIRLYGKKSLNRISVKDVTALAGYSRSTFYIHYPDVPGLLEEIEEEMLDHISITILSVFQDTEKLSADILFAAIKKIFSSNLDLMALLMTKPGSVFPSKLKTFIVHNIQTQFPIYASSKHSNLELAITYQISAVVGVISYWLPRRDQLSIDEMVEQIKEISNEGVFHIIVDNV